MPALSIAPWKSFSLVLSLHLDAKPHIFHKQNLSSVLSAPPLASVLNTLLVDAGLRGGPVICSCGGGVIHSFLPVGGGIFLC